MMVFNNIVTSADFQRAAIAVFDEARQHMLLAFQVCLDSGFSKLSAWDEIEGTENAMTGILKLASEVRR